MSSSYRPRTRGQKAQQMKNVCSGWKRKSLGSNSVVGSEKTSNEVKDSNLKKDERFVSRSVKKTSNVGVESCFSEGIGRKGKRKSFCNVDRNVRKKNQLELSDMSESDDDNDYDGFVYLGERVVENGREILKKDCEKKDYLSSDSSPSSSEIGEKDAVLMKNGCKKSSVSNGDGKKKGKEKKHSNVISLDISDDDDDDDDDDDRIVFRSYGSLSSSENTENDATFMKKGVRSGKNGGKKCSVSSRDAKKNEKERKCSNVGSSDKVFRSGEQLDISYGSGDGDGIKFQDVETIDISDSSLSASSGNNEESDGFESEMKVSSSSNSRGSCEDDDDGGSSSESLTDSKSMSVADVGDSDVNSQPVNSAGLNNMPQTRRSDFVGLEPNTSDSENMGSESDESPNQSVDSSMSEPESSSEEDEDDSDFDLNKDEQSSSDDSVIPHSSSDDNDVGNVSERDNQADGEEENKENGVFVEKTLRSRKKIKRVESRSNDTDVIGKNEEGESKNNGVVEKYRTSRKRVKRKNWKNENDAGINESYRSDKGKFAESGEIKRKNRKKENDAGINEGYRGVKGKSAESGLRNKQVPGIDTSKSQTKDPQCKKFTSPRPIKEGDETGPSTDDNPETLKRECSGRKKGSSKEEVEKFGKKTSRTARNADLIELLFNSINEDDIIVEESGSFQEHLPLKFRFEDELDPPLEKSEEEELIDSLFVEMEKCLRPSETENANKAGSDDISFKKVDETPETCCLRGEHQPILNEQIGTMCRFCGAILLEIKDILPPWYKPRSRRQERKYFDESPTFAHSEFQFHESFNIPNDTFTPVKGTVWDLIPGLEKGLYPHQREGFEFIWKSIAGDIALEKLPKSLSDDGRGCIISHTCGTGKTRLGVVFLLSLLKRYRNAHPVIIAPIGVLSIWEEEFKSKVIPFHNMNNPKLSGNETRFGGGAERQGVRLAKLLSWLRGRGILGISYQLFGSLVSEKGKQDKAHVAFREALIQKPALLVLDEGHIPRNGKSRIWNAIKNVKCKRCIILSGTPFQNTFEELKHTLCLVDPKVEKSSWKELIDADGLKKLRSLLDPYVHLYEGSVLDNSLLGLQDALIRLRPTELQRELLDAAMEEKIFLAKTHLVSLISVHPSALMVDKTTKFVNSPLFSSYKDKLQDEDIKSDLDEGVKIKFVMNLIKLADALGERVLIFSGYINPLVFIQEQLKTRFSWTEGKEVLSMHGKIPMKQRQTSISLFNNGLSEAKVLLATQKACSEGINLVGASRVVLLDTVWNPSVEKQAISRAYRLGQKKRVYVYRLITTCKIEARQCELQNRKKFISKTIFSRDDGQAGEIETSLMALEDKVLEQMLNLETVRTIIDEISYTAQKESDFSER